LVFKYSFQMLKPFLLIVYYYYWIDIGYFQFSYNTYNNLCIQNVKFLNERGKLLVAWNKIPVKPQQNSLSVVPGCNPCRDQFSQWRLLWIS
jgi:hypothetical protein